MASFLIYASLNLFFCLISIGIVYFMVKLISKKLQFDEFKTKVSMVTGMAILCLSMFVIR